jgi:hypothetical protein
MNYEARHYVIVSIHLIHSLLYVQIIQVSVKRLYSELFSIYARFKVLMVMANSSGA